MELDADIWQGALWKPETGTMLHKYGALARDVMLYFVKKFPKDKLIVKYQDITGRDHI